jgi:phage FluMu protein Com
VTIQFHCPYCDKTLKASDDKAGLRVKCPTCGNAITVQESPQIPVAEIDQDGLNESAFEPSPRPHSAPIALDPGEVIGTSWEIYKAQLGIPIGAVVIATFVPIAINYMGSFVATIVGNVGDQVGRRNNMLVPGFTLAWMIIQFGTMLIVWFLQTFLLIGQTIVFLKVVRGQPTEFGDVFRGGHYFLRALGSGILFGLMIAFGLLLLIVPGIIAGLMFWPYLYVLVDTDAPGVDCLARAREITRNTWGTVFVLWLTALGLGMLGALACCFGTIFTAPLAFMLYAVAYCRMTGQRTVLG